MSKVFSWTIVALSTITLAGCATLNVSSHLDRSADFAQYHTWAWGPPDALPTGDPRLDNNPFFKDHFEGAVEKGLASKGYAKATSGAPDLLVHYHANVGQAFEVAGLDTQYGYSSEAQPRVIEYESGTYVIDIVDNATKKVVWRGWAQDSMNGVIDNQDRMNRQIEKAVAGMMEKLPRTL